MQHHCVQPLYREDWELGIPPFFLDFLTDISPSLSNYNLDQIVQLLSSNSQNNHSFSEELDTVEDRGEELHEQLVPADIVYQYNPRSGKYDFEITT